MATNSVFFDTHKAVSMLQKRGLSKDAAEGITDLVKDVTENNLVTKTDLELALHRQSVMLIKWIVGVIFAQGAFIVGILQVLQ
jgi:hypothetical protein